jgi:tetrahydromethanopterin S-methyltransferase subunit G
MEPLYGLVVGVTLMFIVIRVGCISSFYNTVIKHVFNL